MAPVPESAALDQHVEDACAWADRTLGRVSVALVYGGVSVEDQLYISKSPPAQLSVTALSDTLTGLGVRFEVLDPCRPSFIRDLARFDVAMPNLHGLLGLRHADVAIAMLREALTRPRYNAPLPVPDFTGWPVQHS